MSVEVRPKTNSVDASTVAASRPQTGQSRVPRRLRPPPPAWWSPPHSPPRRLCGRPRRTSAVGRPPVGSRGRARPAQRLPWTSALPGPPTVPCASPPASPPGSRLGGSTPAVLTAAAHQGRGLQSARPRPFDAAALTAAYAVLAATELHRGGRRSDRNALARTAREPSPTTSSRCRRGHPDTALRATADHAFLADFWTGCGRLLPLPLAQAGLRLVVDMDRPLPKRTLAQRREECARAARALGVSSLREVSDLAAALPASAARGARHASGTQSRKPTVNAVVGLPRRLRRGDRPRQRGAPSGRLRHGLPQAGHCGGHRRPQRCTGARMAGSGHRAAARPRRTGRRGACGHPRRFHRRAAGLRAAWVADPPRRAPAALNPTSTRTPH